MAAPVTAGSRTANSARTAQGTEDVNFTLPNNTDHIILGCGVTSDNADRIDPGASINLQFRTGADAFANVTSTSTVKDGNTNLVDENALTTGERLTTGGGTFVNGKEIESNPSTQSAEIRNQTTESQWSLDFSGATPSTTYDFRVQWEYKNGTVVINYISITTVASLGSGLLLGFSRNRLIRE